MFRKGWRWTKICESCFLSGTTEESIGKRSVEQCKNECYAKEGCKTINYGIKDQVCWLVYGKINAQSRSRAYDDNVAYSLEFGKNIRTRFSVKSFNVIIMTPQIFKLC